LLPPVLLDTVLERKLHPPGPGVGQGVSPPPAFLTEPSGAGTVLVGGRVRHPAARRKR
jgi:hypothetical protein